MPQKCLTVLRIRKIQILSKKWPKSQTKAQKAQKTINLYLGDLVTRMGEQEIGAVFWRLLDNPGELACMS